MKINSREKVYKFNEKAFSLINYIQTNEKRLNMINSELYYDFPIFKDFDGDILTSQILIASASHGIICISIANEKISINDLIEKTDQVHSIIFSRLLRNKNLRETKTSLKFNLNSIIFDNYNFIKDREKTDIEIIETFGEFDSYLDTLYSKEIDSTVYSELIATIEGAKGLLRPKERSQISDITSKGYLITEIEKEINSFDEFQKKAFINEIVGPERIRGLAGSGKTVVLALKAAMTHLRHPDAEIVYTFYTKSLYQHIQRLITRFYRQYDDKDPDWNKLKIVHAWGSANNSGIYYEACSKNNIPYLSFSKASAMAPERPFEYACNAILPYINSTSYDYIFIDEGQDFPESFIKLCVKLCKNGRIVWAYDELQTIFQAKTPSIDSVLEGSPYKGLEEDIILYKCYRNPREVLVIAHAIGFGIYSNKIVQMLDEQDYWNDIGYKIIEGNFKKGSKIVIERPIENSLESMSSKYDKKDIIQFKSYSDYNTELINCANNIHKDIQDGLRPDDILVIVADDRNAQMYLKDIQHHLSIFDIKSNNIHSDKFNIKDFSIDNHVTLSTIHKAKGNEAYSVHIVGIDSLYSLVPTIRERNLMFTAITRTKGWVRLSGIGKPAQRWIDELQKAFHLCPRIEFIYPSEEELSIMKRDIQDTAIRKSKQAKMLDDLLSEMSPEEIKQFLDQREIKKRKR